MDKALRAEWLPKWVEALRSGKYRQACGVLRAESGAFCCLGVLREIRGSWEGLSNNEILTHDELLDLVDRNDGSGGYPRHSFPEIADYIEGNL